MIRISAATTNRALLILTWPFVQLLLLRFYLHSVLGLRLGFGNTTDFDYIIPAPIAFIVLMQVLEDALPSKLSLQRVPLLINLVSTVLFVILNHAYDALSLVSPFGLVSVWFGLLTIIGVSGFCVFVAPSYYAKNPNRFAFLPCILIGTSLFFYTNSFHEGWNWLGSFTSTIIYEFFARIPFAQITSAFSKEGELTISHPLFAVRIAKACGGFDSFFFFSLAFLLAATLYGKAVRFTKLLIIYSGGILMMYVLNLFRILFLFYVGIWLQKVLPYKTAINIFKLFFHIHFGWFLYSAGILWYRRLWANLIRREVTLSLPVFAPA